MEDDMTFSEGGAPALDCIHDSKHLLDLNMLLAQLLWAASHKPLRAIVAAQALGAAGVHVYIDCAVHGGQEADAVP